jgi:DNA-binding CsgD family transcriptional regulator
MGSESYRTFIGGKYLMTQYEQIIAALKQLGGKATVTEICEKLDFKKWTTKTPKNSVSRYLTCSSQIKREKDDNKFYYILDESIPYSDLVPSRKDTNNLKMHNDKNHLSKNDNNDIGKYKDNGLYFICLGSDVVLPVAGSIFKIGRTENIMERMNNYSNSLPFDPIRQIAFFPVPNEIIEKKLNEIDDGYKA